MVDGHGILVDRGWTMYRDDDRVPSGWTMSTVYAPCDDCDTVTTITIEPYGAGKMATIDCPECGLSYDTNLEGDE